MMLDQYLKRIDEVHKRLETKQKVYQTPYFLNDLCEAVAECGFVDRIAFHEIPADELTDPDAIHGKVEVYSYSAAVYALPETAANIYYIDTLDPLRKRVVICKELSHLLVKGARIQNTTQLIHVLKALSLPGETKEILSCHEQLESEQVAVFAGLEMLCPHRFRVAMLPKIKSGEITAEEISTRFGVPVEEATTLIDEDFIEVIDAIKNQTI